MCRFCIPIMLTKTNHTSWTHRTFSVIKKIISKFQFCGKTQFDKFIYIVGIQKKNTYVLFLLSLLIVWRILRKRKFWINSPYYLFTVRYTDIHKYIHTSTKSEIHMYVALWGDSPSSLVKFALKTRRFRRLAIFSVAFLCF